MTLVSLSHQKIKHNKTYTHKKLHLTSGPLGSNSLPHDSSKHCSSTMLLPRLLLSIDVKAKIEPKTRKTRFPTAMFVWNTYIPEPLAVAFRVASRGYKANAWSIFVPVETNGSFESFLKDLLNF